MLQKTGAAPTIVIVGAGPVGLMTALLLAEQGLASLIVERFKTRHGAPKAHAINPRSLEICRAMGLDVGAMEKRATPREDGGWVRFMTNLAGREIGVLPYERQDDAVREITPTPLINLSQPDFEDFLLERIAKEPLVEIRRGLDWLSCRQDCGEVFSTLRDTDSGETVSLRSDYLIGADGAGSVVRRELDIDMEGGGSGQSFITIHFAANLRSFVKDRPAILYWIMQPPHTGVLIAYNIDGNWCLLYPYDPIKTSRETFTKPVCADIVRHVIGVEDIAIDIKHILPWMMMSEVAERYQQGKVFLVGDAAHRFPPMGGLGLNTGLQDAHNLAWKIAAVAKFGAPTALLESYEAERRKVALTNAGQSFKNAQRILSLQTALRTQANDDPAELAARLDDLGAQAEIRAQIENQREHFDSLGLQLGFTYGEREGEVGDISFFRPTLSVGARLPHAWLTQDGRVISSLDLLDSRGFTLLVGERNVYPELMTRAPVKVVVAGSDYRDGSGWFSELLGFAKGHAILVRPDGHVSAILADVRPADIQAAVTGALCMQLVGADA